MKIKFALGILAAVLVVAGNSEAADGGRSLVGAELDAALSVVFTQEVTVDSDDLSGNELEVALLLPPNPVAATREDPKPGVASNDPFAGYSKNLRPMTGKCDTACWILTGGLAAGGMYALTAMDVDDAESIGDITQMLPAVGGLTMTLVTRDWQGLRQFGLAGGTTFAVTHGLKEAVSKARPNEADGNSFPSGHTSASFFGAGFIHERYGPRWGVPAYAMAVYTGLSRVNAQKHFLDDVVSGMSIGLMSNWLFTTPVSPRLTINPMLAKGGVGVSASFATAKDFHQKEIARSERSDPRFHFRWEFGQIEITENFVQAPADGGSEVDFLWEGENNPTMSGNVSLEWYPGEGRHSVAVGLAPFEIRDFGMLEEDLVFGDTTFYAGDQLRTGFVAYDLGLRYRYALFPDTRFDIRVGGGISLLYTLAELAVLFEGANAENLDFTRVDDYVFAPLLHLRFGYLFGAKERWEVFAEIDGIDVSTDRYYNATAKIVYQVAQRWDLSLGYRLFDRVIDTDTLQNKTEREQITVGVGYRF